MNLIANSSRRALIRFGKVCPFVLCFVVLISDIENICAISTNDVIVCDGILIYNTPISFAIGLKVEYDILLVFVVALISLSIEACFYNIASILFLVLNLYRKQIFFNDEPYDDLVYYIAMILDAIIAAFFVYKGLTILFMKSK